MPNTWNTVAIRSCGVIRFDLGTSALEEVRATLADFEEVVQKLMDAVNRFKL